MTTTAPADILAAAKFEKLVQDYRDEISQGKIVADKLRSEVARPSQAAVEPALVYRLSR